MGGALECSLNGQEFRTSFALKWIRNLGFELGFEGKLSKSMNLTWLTVALCLPTALLTHSCLAGSNSVEFDATIELNPDMNGYHTILFARYWVGQGFYRVAIIWAEPNGSGLAFPVYPPTLSIGSDPYSFTIEHPLQPQNAGIYSKPFGDRGTFQWMFGDYPIANVRFADEDATASRLLCPIPENSASPGRAGSTLGSTRKSIQSPNASNTFQITADGEKIESIEIFTSQGALIKAIGYEYLDGGKTAAPLKQRVFLNERIINTTLRNGDTTVTLGQAKYHVTNFNTVHEKGGRFCTVEYSSVSPCNHQVQLPATIEARDGHEGRLIRSAILSNYHCFSGTPQEAAQLAATWASFTPAQSLQRDLLRKYWRMTPPDLSPDDARTATKLLPDLNRSAHQDPTVGQRLKSINLVMELDRLLGREDDLLKDYDHYLCTLTQAGYSNMVLVGGYRAIEMAVLWGRSSEASKLLDRWLESAAAADPKLALRFATRELGRGNYWPIIRLLDNLQGKDRLSVGQKFECAALTSIALDNLIGLASGKVSRETRRAKAQPGWVSSTDVGPLQLRLQNESTLAHHLLSKSGELTDSQKLLAKKLIQITNSQSLREVGRP